MKSVKVIIADDHTLIRAGIKQLLQNIKGVEVIAEASNGREAMQLVKEILPDILLLDVAMSELNGLEVTEQISKENISVSIIILSMYANEEYVIQALKAGASGYILKDAAPTELELAINAVIKGEIYLSPSISKNLVTDYLRRINNGMTDEKDHENVFVRLTLRQREILQLIAEGNSTKEIANKLNVSIKTIETHRSQIMERLDIHDIPGLVRYAIRSGIIQSQ